MYRFFLGLYVAIVIYVLLYFNFIIVMIYSPADNPVTTPGIVETCIHNSTNVQFQYETEEKLDSQLRMEYGNVSSF